MAICEYCQKEKNAANICPDCGKTIYTAGGKIIYGGTAKDVCGCETTITDKYLIIRRVSGGERTGDVLGRSAGLLGVFVAEVAKGAKDKTYGFYELNKIQKGIFPYRTNGIKKKNAIKLINKDGTDFILIFDKPGFVDGTAKVLKKMVGYITAAIPLVEDGSNMNYGTTHCTRPFVTAQNFDKIKPGYASAASGSAPNSSQGRTAAPTTPPSAQANKAPSQPAQKAENPAPQPTYASAASTATPPSQNNSSPSDDKVCCPNCGTYVLSTNKFCNECGAKIELQPKRVIKCLRCGEVLNDSDKFCGSCGYQNKFWQEK